MPEPQNTPPGNYDIEPSAGVREAAHAIRELFVALSNEGFTERQALVILGQMLAANAATGGGDSK